MSTELRLKFQAAPAVLFLQTQLPARMVVDLNRYMNARHNKGAASFAHKLVGQISHGEQLKMDTEDPLVQPFVQVVANLSQSYLEQFTRMIGANPLHRVPHVHSLWSVHSYERDYNPVHDHGVDTIMGISLTTCTNIPSQIADV